MGNRKPGKAAREAVARKRANRAAVLTAKGRPCADCGGVFPYYVMDLDHRPGETKLFSLAHGVNRSRGAVVAEIAKCDVVCANCHRIRTHTRHVDERVAAGLSYTAAMLLADGGSLDDLAEEDECEPEPEQPRTPGRWVRRCR